MSSSLDFARDDPEPAEGSARHGRQALHFSRQKKSRRGV